MCKINIASLVKTIMPHRGWHRSLRDHGDAMKISVNTKYYSLSRNVYSGGSFAFIRLMGEPYAA
jgi:hypothetical protein